MLKNSSARLPTILSYPNKHPNKRKKKKCLYCYLFYVKITIYPHSGDIYEAFK